MILQFIPTFFFTAYVIFFTAYVMQPSSSVGTAE